MRKLRRAGQGAAAEEVCGLMHRLRTGWVLMSIIAIVIGSCAPVLEAAPPRELPPLTDDACHNADILDERMEEIAAELVEKGAPLTQLLAQKQSLEAELDHLRRMLDIAQYAEEDIAAARDLAAKQKADFEQEAKACRDMANILYTQQLALFHQEFAKYMAQQKAKGNDIGKLEQAKKQREEIIAANSRSISQHELDNEFYDMMIRRQSTDEISTTVWEKGKASNLREIETLKNRSTAAQRVIQTIDQMYDPQTQSPDEIVFRHAKLREVLGQEKNTWDQTLDQLGRDQDHARRVTAELFLGADPVILTSMDAEAILREHSPTLKADLMTKRAEMFEQMALGVDQGLQSYIRMLQGTIRLRDIPETAELASNLEELIQETDALMAKVTLLQQDYNELKLHQASWALQCTNPVGQILDTGGATIVRADPTKSAHGLEVGQVIATQSGEWKEGPTNHPVPENKAYTIGPFTIPAPCKIRARVTGNPPIERTMTATNGGAGMVGKIEPLLLRQGIGIDSFSVVLGVGQTEAAQEIDVKYPASMLLTFTPALHTGQAGGYQYAGQSYKGTVEVIELLKERAAMFGTTILSGDRVRANNWFPTTIKLFDGTTIFIRTGSEVTFSETEKGGVRATLERGDMRITGAGPEFEASFGGEVIKPKGTDFIVDQYGVKVVDGEVEIIDEQGNETVAVQAGQQMVFNGGKVTEFDVTTVAPFTTGGGLPATTDFLEPTEEPYGAKSAQFNNNTVADGWLLADPPARHDPKGVVGTGRVGVETPEASVLRLAVPVGSVVAGYDRAPRLLHKVTGDFDLEAELRIEEAHGNPVSADFVVHAPGTGIGLEKKQAEWGKPALDYWLPPPCVVRLAAGGPFLLPAFNDHGQLSRYDWSEATDGKVRARLSRRGDIWAAAWSLDGQNWNTHTLDWIDLPQTLWVGWAFQHTRQASAEPAIFTVRDVRLETAPAGSMATPVWRTFSVNGSAQSQDASVRLTLDGGSPGAARVLSGAQWSGDFDVVVRFDAGQWQHQPGELRRWSVAAMTLDQQEAVAVGCIVRDDGQRYWAQRQKGFEAGSAMGQSSPVEHAQGRLRLTRQGGVLSAYYWDAEDWQRQKFHGEETPLEGPLFLRLEAHNGRANAKHPWAPMSVDFTVEQASMAAAPSAADVEPVDTAETLALQEAESEPQPADLEIVSERPSVETASPAGAQLEEPPPAPAVSPAEQPGILEFTATPLEVDAGQPFNLSWKTGGDRPFLYRMIAADGTLQLESNEALPPTGSMDVASEPSVDGVVNFALVLMDPQTNEALDMAFVEVKVRAAAAPPPPEVAGIAAFTADLQEAKPGEQITLSWQTSGGQPYLYRLDENGQPQPETNDTLSSTGSLAVPVDASMKSSVTFALGLFAPQTNEWLDTATVTVKIKMPSLPPPPPPPPPQDPYEPPAPEPQPQSQPAVQPVPGAYTVFFSIGADGRPWGYVFDKEGRQFTSQGGALTISGPQLKPEPGDRIYIKTDAPRFSFLFDCGTEVDSYSPCDFMADSPAGLPAEIVANHRNRSGYLNISGPDNWAGERNNFPGQRYPAEPVLRIVFGSNW